MLVTTNLLSTKADGSCEHPANLIWESPQNTLTLPLLPWSITAEPPFVKNVTTEGGRGGVLRLGLGGRGWSMNRTKLERLPEKIIEGSKYHSFLFSLS